MASIANRISHLKHAHGYLLFRAQHLCGTMLGLLEDRLEVFSHTGWQLDDAIYGFWALCVPEYDAICAFMASARAENDARIWHIANNMLMMLGLLEDRLERAAQNEDALALHEVVGAIIDYAEGIPGSMKLWLTESGYEVKSDG